MVVRCKSKKKEVGPLKKNLRKNTILIVSKKKRSNLYKNQKKYAKKYFFNHIKKKRSDLYKTRNKKIWGGNFLMLLKKNIGV